MFNQDSVILKVKGLAISKRYRDPIIFEGTSNVQFYNSTP